MTYVPLGVRKLTEAEERYRTGKAGRADHLILAFIKSRLRADHGNGTGWVSSREIQTHTGVPQATICGNLKQMTAYGQIEQHPKRKHRQGFLYRFKRDEPKGGSIPIGKVTIGSTSYQVLGKWPDGALKLEKDGVRFRMERSKSEAEIGESFDANSLHAPQVPEPTFLKDLEAIR